MRQVRPSKLSDVPSQSLGSRRRRRTRRRVPTVCGTGSQVRQMQTANGRPPAFTRLVPRCVPFRHVQLGVVDRVRAPTQPIMPNSSQSGRARPATYPTRDRPNAVRSKRPRKQTPCHRCRRRRNRLMTVPVRRLPVASPSEEKRRAGPPARRRAPRQLRPHPHFGQLSRTPCQNHPMTAQFPSLQFCCVNHGKGNEASPAPTWRAPCRHLSQRPCCPTPKPKVFAYRSYPK